MRRALTRLFLGSTFALAISLISIVQARADSSSVLEMLPPQVKSLYDGDTENLQKSAYDDFRSVATPWKWCHAEAYQGNPWRVALTNEMRRLVSTYQRHGLARDFEVTDANGDTGRQIAQIHDFIDKKCSIITLVASSATGLDDAIEDAFRHGIPVVTIVGAVTSPYAINVDANFYAFGASMATAITTLTDGHANVLMVEGIPGYPIVVQERKGAEKVFQAHPGIHVLRAVNGNFTASITKTAVLQSLATLPQRIDAVWTVSSETRIIEQAFAQAGRPLPLVTGTISGDALGFWKAEPDDYHFDGAALLPSWVAQALFQVGVRVLQGQQPRLNTIIIPIPLVHKTDLAELYRSCMAPNSSAVFPVVAQSPISADLMTAYFKRPITIPYYSYDDTPDPCTHKSH